MPMTPRPVVGDAKRWKALAHPLRGEMLRHLDSRGPATSTTIAEALDENTGTTSYPLRVLADAGIIEEVPERAHGRERWWRTFLTDHREPDYDSLTPEDRAALDEWRAQQVPPHRPPRQPLPPAPPPPHARGRAPPPPPPPTPPHPGARLSS